MLAHGYTATLDMWRPQVAPFSAEYRLVIYDSRGHGDTTAPANLDEYDLARDFVADQVALMDHLGIGQAYVGGLSMGGMIAQEFALQHPHRVKALLLFDTGPGKGRSHNDPASLAQYQKMRQTMQLVVRTKGVSAMIDAMRNHPMVVQRLEGRVLPEGVSRHFDNMRRMSVDGYLGAAGAMQTWAGSFDRLRALRVPTLVMVGERDGLLPASHLIHLEIAGSRFVVINGCGHGTKLWRPESFNAETRDFLEAVDAGRDVAGEFVVR